MAPDVAATEIRASFGQVLSSVRDWDAMTRQYRRIVKYLLFWKSVLEVAV